MTFFYISMEGAIFVCLLIASFMLHGKGAMLISGYNTLSAEKRALFDERKLCKFVGWMMIRVALYLGLFILAQVLDIIAILWVGFGLMMLDAVVYNISQTVFNKKRFLK